MPVVSEDDLPHVPGVLLGGPLDGARYRIPLLPVGATVPPRSISIPLQPPGPKSASYERTDDEPVGGYYLYFFCSPGGPNDPASVADLATVSAQH